MSLSFLRALTYLAALTVLAICVYLFVEENGILEGEFRNEGLVWYFLAKGIFCSVSLVLSVRILDALAPLSRGAHRS